MSRGITFTGGVRYTASSQTVADGGTIAPLASYVLITCSDGGGCDLTISETGAPDGMVMTIVNTSTNELRFADTAGVQELDGTFTASQYQTLTVMYRTDRWVELCRSPGGGGGGSGDVVGPASSVDTELALFDSTTGKLLKRATGTGVVRAASGVYSASKLKRTVGMVIGDGVNVIGTGVAGFVSCLVAGTITKVRLLSTDPATTSGSIVVDVWKDAYSNYPPTVADTITASAKPTITTTTKSEDSTLTGWTTSVSAGDVFGFKVDSITSLKRVIIELTVDE